MSEVSICNRALTKVGGNRITAFTDGTKEANLCDLHYEPCRDAVQQAYDWSFNRERAQLSADAQQPVFGYDNRFLLPFDQLTVWQATVDPRGEVDVDRWTVEGRYLLADFANPIFIRYAIRVRDDSRFPPLFTEALVEYLAATLAIPLAESRALQGDLLQTYAYKLSEASAVDGLQGRSERTYGGRAERARHTRGTLHLRGRYG